MNLVFARSAAPDLKWFTVYYGSVFPRGRERAERRFAATVAAIRQNPRIGRMLEGFEVYEFPVLGTPFSMIYFITQSRIEVLRVWDGRADRNKLNWPETQE